MHTVNAPAHPAMSTLPAAPGLQTIPTIPMIPMIPSAPSTSSDATLWAAVCAGDRAAFGEIVGRYQSLVAAITYSRCGNAAAAADLAQETFVTAWRQAATLRDAASLRAWLGGIARNLTADAARREARRGGAGTPLDAIAEPIAREADPEQQALRREEEALVWRALAALPETYREPLVLFYREEQSVAAVADQLDLSLDATKQRLSRGRTLLREEVSALIEGTLRRSRPGPGFTAAVLAAVATIAPGAASAAMVAIGGAGDLGLGLGDAGGNVAGRAPQLGFDMASDPTTTLDSDLLSALDPHLASAADPQVAEAASAGIAGATAAGHKLLAGVGGTGGGAVLGPAAGLATAWLAARLARATARSTAEGELISRQFRLAMAFVVPMILLVVGLVAFGVGLLRENPWFLAGSTTAWTVALVGGLIALSQHFGRRIAALRRANGTDDEAWDAQLVARGLRPSGPRRHASRRTFLGLPLFAFASNDLDAGASARDGRSHVARGWIAIGDVAISPLFAFGGIAIAPIAVGGVTIGLLSLSLGGIALGALALGSIACGLTACGVVAVGWYGAAGVAAIAHAYALGPAARAAEANTAAASSWFASQWFTTPTQFFFALLPLAILAAIVLPLALMARRAWQRRRSAPPATR